MKAAKTYKWTDISVADIGVGIDRLVGDVSAAWIPFCYLVKAFEVIHNFHDFEKKHKDLHPTQNLVELATGIAKQFQECEYFKSCKNNSCKEIHDYVQDTITEMNISYANTE